MRADFVNEVARVLKISRRDLIEKDLILHQILAGLSQDNFFAENFLFKGGGALILNLAGMKGWQRKILVSFVLAKLDEVAQIIGSLAVFFEEAHLYVESQNIIDIVTRMRHLGIYPTFITNVPSTLPDEIYTLLDNLVEFLILNETDLNHIARSGKIDLETIATLKLLEQGKCMMVGRATSNYPLFVHITPVPNVVMGGDTKPPVRT